MKFFVSTFPVKKGNVDLDDQYLKVDIPDSKGSKGIMKNIPVNAISQVNLEVVDNKSKNVTIGFVLVQIMELLGLVIFVMNLSKLPMMIVGGLLLLFATVMAFMVVSNKRKCLLTVEQNDNKTLIEGAYVEREKFIKLYDALFEKIKNEDKTE